MIIELVEGEIPVIRQQGDYAIVAITKHGVEMARDLAQKFPGTDLYYMSKFARGDEEARGIQLFSNSVRMLFPALWPVYKGLIVIISLGAVVRMIAPLLEDKKKDPGVVVVDDRGENVISVLSGHLGGANELAREVAAVMGARPIITTASDVQKTIPVDLFGRRFGWEWDSADKLTPVSASVVNEEHVAVVNESGERDWWMHDTPMPPSIKEYASIAEAQAAKPHAALVVTHRLLAPEEQTILDNGVLYRPKVIVLGMGCNRGTSAEEIEAVIRETLDELQFSLKSVKALATIELKKDEAGLIAVCEKYGWPFVWYSPQELNQVEISEPSETVFKFTGAYGVSEPAAKLYAGVDELVLTKKKSGNVTISVALMPYYKEERA
ncbi:cobalamin biosynthesis protein [Brevibacillus agri]|uniref:cobalt-precorrin 5A hydrolase n=1 Tax=Brevibacillus agri TaxID=51101 RepID=UPI001EE61895|nr:cobalamin biosynthesis protein [Brevibacillus agri]MCG5254078.1 cobalamin biosynthesis protein [Brevibacillus agri]MED1642937.1 cobalamin biosynthesis protein [Brevibacillus agri]MED1652629.1 cobalamin biosynthesis protein [Brevibacillus agri]MED1688323.1 cobalamin biosynthesis protein [Brevibacillus agri]MED1692277.1 cobalamin biosynthesis protein [Brevibacillus agri]